MKRRVAIVRGPNLNSWEMQNFTPLLEEFDLAGFTSYGHNFDINNVTFEVRKLFSMGQFVRSRVIRNVMSHFLGDYHDLLGLERSLQGFDIVHCAETSYYCTFQAAKAKRKANFKLVVTVWENIPFLYHLPLTQRNKELIFNETDLFLPVTECAKEVLLLEGAPKEKIRVQMPGINTAFFFPTRKDPDLLRRFDCHSEDFIILYVANLYREKGIYDLLFAIRLLLDRLRESVNLRLLVAGKGREYNGVVRWIHKLRMEHRVKLIGSHPYAMMPKIHNLADIFVLPSIPVPFWQEQFGYVLIESMACGKPVISTLTGSIPEVVGNAGLLVPPNDFVSLASAMETLLANVQKRSELGDRGRARAETIFDSRRVADQYKNCYASLMNHG